MNLIKDIDDVFKKRHLTDIEKIRYIYLHCCKVFSFDKRWVYAHHFCDVAIKEKIMNQKFDLENIETDLVICHTLVPKILKQLVDYYTSSKITTTVLGGSTHKSLLVEDNKSSIGLNPAMEDIHRVKYNLTTDGFSSRLSLRELRGIDSSFGIKLEDSIDLETRIYDGNSDYEYIQNAAHILQNSDAKRHFLEAYFIIREYFYFLPSNLKFLISPDYETHDIIVLKKSQTYFDLSKEDGEYGIREISEDQVRKLTSDKRFIQTNKR